MSGVTPEAATRLRELAQRTLDADGDCIECREYDNSQMYELAEAALALLSELATARQERDGAILESDERGAKWNAAEAELVVVRRQLEEARKAWRNLIDRSEEAADNYDSPAYANFQAEVDAARERLRAVLGAGQEQW